MGNPDPLELGGLGRHQFSFAVGVARLNCKAMSFRITEFALPSRKAFMLASGVLALPPDIQPIRATPSLAAARLPRVPS
jgi:hypothetical protein